MLNPLRQTGGSLRGTTLAEAIHEGRKIELSAVVVEGPVDLVAAEYSHRVIIQNSTFKGLVVAVDARFTKSVDFSGSTFEASLDLSDARIGGSLILAGATIRTSSDQILHSAVRVTKEGRVASSGHGTAPGTSESNAVIKQRMDVDAETESALLSEARRIARSEAIHFERVHVDGVLDATEVNCEAAWYLIDAELKGGLEMRGAHLGGSLWAARSVIGGDLTAAGTSRRRTDIEGFVNLQGAKVRGHVWLIGARISRDLSLSSAEIGGSLFCASHLDQPEVGRTLIEGVLSLGSASVAGQVDLSGAIIGEILAAGLMAGSLLCRVDEATQSPMEVAGAVTFTSVRIFGSVELSGVWIRGENAKGPVLRMDYADIGGHLLCERTHGRRRTGEDILPIGATILGDVWLFGAKIAGSVSFVGGSLIKGQLYLEGAVVGLNLVCGAEDRDDRPMIDSRVVLRQARIGGGVDFSRCILGRAASSPLLFDLEQVEIGGDLVCNKLSASCVIQDQKVGTVSLKSARVKGNVRFREADVGGTLDMDGAQIAGQVDLARALIEADLQLRSAQVDGQLFGAALDTTCPQVRGRVLLTSARLREVGIYFHSQGTRPKEVNMDRAQIDILKVSGTLPPAGTTVFTCDDLEFRQIELGGILIARMGARQPPSHLPVSDAHYLAFLNRTRFAKNVYLRLESWLRNRGEDVAADKVYLKMRREDLRTGMPLGQKLLHWFLYGTVGYGVRPWRTGLVAAFVFVLSFLIFLDPSSVQHRLAFTVGQSVQPINPNAMRPAFPEEYDAGQPKAEAWRWFDAAWMAFRLQVPMIELVVRNEWEPAPRPIEPVCVTNWLKGVRAAGPFTRCAAAPQVPFDLHTGPGAEPEAQTRRLPLRYDAYASVVTVLNWIILPLLLASFSGLLKKGAVEFPR